MPVGLPQRPGEPGELGDAERLGPPRGLDTGHGERPPEVVRVAELPVRAQGVEQRLPPLGERCLHHLG